MECNRANWFPVSNLSLPPPPPKNNKRRRRQTVVHGKLKTEQHESHKKSGARVRCGASKCNIPTPKDSSVDILTEQNKSPNNGIVLFYIYRIFFFNLLWLYFWMGVLSNEILWFGTQCESILYLSNKIYLRLHFGISGIHFRFDLQVIVDGPSTI